MAATMEKSRAQSTMYRTRRNSISPPPGMSPLRVVLLGKTGSGKSASANTILGKKAFEENVSFESVTKICSNKENVVEGRQITVIDTPGLSDTEKPIEELKGELEKCVEMSVPGPHAFLLVMRLDVRYTEEERNVVKWIQENFGEGALKYTIVLLTHGDVLEGKPVEDFLCKSPVLSSLTKRVGGRYHVFNNKSEDSTQVIELKEIIEAMVKENGEANYTSEMYKEVQRKIEREKEESERKEEERRKAEEEKEKKQESDRELEKREEEKMKRRKAEEEKRQADEERRDRERRKWRDADKEERERVGAEKKAEDEKKRAESEQKKKEDEVRCMKKMVEMSVGAAVGIGGLGVAAATAGGVVAVAAGGGGTAAVAVAAVVAGGGAAVVAVVAVAAGAAAAAAAVGGAVTAVAAGGGVAAAVAAAAVGAAGGGVVAVAAALAGAATAAAAGGAAAVVAGAAVGAAAVAIGRHIC